MAFISFFAQQTRLDNPQTTFSYLPAASQESPEDFSTSPCEVYDVLSRLIPSKDPDLYGLSRHLLRLCATGRASGLCTLFNRSLSEAAVPSALKKTLVVPV